MVVYTLEQRWEVGLRSTYRRCRFWQNNHLFIWSSFWSWRLCKQAKLLPLGHRKSTRIHWEADATTTSHCLVQNLVQRHNWVIFLRKWMNLQSVAIVIGHWCWTDFCSQKFKRRILATFGYNRKVLRATQPKIHSMFCVLFLKITLSVAVV